MKEKKCSFILPTMNVEKYIGPLLENIFSQEYDGEIEVLIQDSSNDGITPKIIKQFPVTYVWVEPDDYNYGKTRNEGASITDGEFLVFLSTDIEIIDNKWLAKLTGHFSDPAVAGVYGRQVPRKDCTPMEQCFIRHTYPPDSATIAIENGKVTRRQTPVIFSNVNSAIRRSVWERIKIPEMLKGEEEEWAKRALIDGGKIVYDADAAVYHSHNYSLKRVFHDYFDTGVAYSVSKKNKIVEYPLRRFVAEGLIYITGEYKFMLTNGYTSWIPYAIIYDELKLLGMALGYKHRYIPLRVKRALCRKKNHWDQYDDVIKEPL